jgi:hypothetical protein
MKSRYDFMKESKKAVDSEDGLAYPDPLSINYKNTQLTEQPTYLLMEDKYLNKFWQFMYDIYGITEMDDILLMLNNVPYIGSMEPGDPLYLIKQEDLENFATQKQPGA